MVYTGTEAWVESFMVGCSGDGSVRVSRKSRRQLHQTAATFLKTQPFGFCGGGRGPDLIGVGLHSRQAYSGFTRVNVHTER